MAFGFDPRQRAGLAALGYKPPTNPYEKYGYRDEDVAGLLNTADGDLPILEETTEVQPAAGVSGLSGALGIRGGSGTGGEMGTPRFSDEVTVRPPAEAPDFVNRFGAGGPEILGGFLGGIPGAEIGKRFAVPDLGQKIDELPGDEEALARLGRGTSEAYNFARELHPMGRLAPEHRIGPETQATLDRLDAGTGSEMTPGQLAPSAPGASGAPADAPEIGLTPEQWMERHAAAPYAKALEGLGEGTHPGFDVGPPKGLGDITGREVGAAGLRTEDGGRTAGVTAFDTPGGGTTYRSTGDNSIFVRDAHGPAGADELAGLRNRAFNAPSGPDPNEAAFNRLQADGGGGHIMPIMRGPDVSQATLEHAMQQRAANAQLSDMESQARARAAEATARERDPLQIERLKAQQALEAARFGYQNEGRREVSLADDQYRAQQQAALNAQRDKARTDYIDNRRALEEQIAAYPPNLPPDSPEAAYVARLQRELERLNQDAEIQLHARIG